jgi:hypothetical protein
MITRFRVLECIALFTVTTFLSNAHAETAMQEPRPTVIELFTSQGCSSCPPAEEILRTYVNKPNALVLAFHVDYWDYLGWHDPFALPVSAQRQQRYGQALQLKAVVTPQSIVDGRASIAGADRTRIAAALKRQASGIPLTLSKAGDVLSINLPESSVQYDVHVITYQQEAATKVPHGENAGHTLREYNIVRSFQSLPRWDGHARQINQSLANIPSGANHIAVLVQQVDQGMIVGAASLAL